MDIGGRSDCRCRLDDKFFFRSTLGPVLFCPFLYFYRYRSEKRTSLIILDSSAADCHAFFLTSSFGFFDD